MEDQKPLEVAFLMIKPDGVRRHLTGEVLRRIEKTDLNLVAARLVIPSARLAAKHYRRKDNWTSGLTVAQAVGYLTSGPVLITVWAGEAAVKKLRKLVGSKTNPNSCKRGTIRRDFADDSIIEANLENRAVRNVVHSSNNPRSALSEITLWFGKGSRRRFVR